MIDAGTAEGGYPHMSKNGDFRTKKTKGGAAPVRHPIGIWPRAWGGINDPAPAIAALISVYRLCVQLL